jgi:hypothetical protein
VWKNIKAHKEQTIYTLTGDDIDGINYQVRDVVEEETQQMSQNHEKLHQKVQEKLTTL